MPVVMIKLVVPGATVERVFKFSNTFPPSAATALNDVMPEDPHKASSKAATILCDLIGRNPRDPHLHYMLLSVDEAVRSHQGREQAHKIRTLGKESNLPFHFKFSMESLERED